MAEPLQHFEGSASRRQRVNLVKTSAVGGSAPVGEQAEFLFHPDASREDCVRRAYRLLKRDRPDENVMSWTVEGEAAR